MINAHIKIKVADIMQVYLDVAIIIYSISKTVQ